MKVSEAIPALVADVARFGDLADRVEGLIETQVSRFRSGTEEWIILPWGDSYYLLSETSEGQRRGREVAHAFLGPSIALIESVSEEYLDNSLPPAWKATGVVKASALRRVAPGASGERELLARLEDLVAAVCEHTPPRLEFRPSHSDLLRDFRLALVNLDADSAHALLDQILLSGHVSAENARYLKIEYLAAFGRWTEMRAMPHIDALLKARRPRTTSETLLRMVWWSDLARPEFGGPLRAFRERAVLDTFGALLRAVRVPSTPEGRSVAYLAAVAKGDEEWQDKLLDQAASPDERAALEALVQDIHTLPPPEPPGAEPPTTPTLDPVVDDFNAGRFGAVVRAFTSNHDPAHAELAIAAILDSGDQDSGDVVVGIVRDLLAQGTLALSRRGRRDLEDLEKALAGHCSDWIEWATRLAADVRWADGATVLRNERGTWHPLNRIGARPLADVCNSLLQAAEGPNADQVRTSLDILCNEAAGLLALGQPNEFSQTVLLLLFDQENFSEMVRNAYLDLFVAWLAAGPTSGDYRDVLDQALAIWKRIAAPNSVDWASSILEAMVDAPCPDEPKRTSTAVLIIEGVRQHAGRLGLRQQVEVEGLAMDFGLPAREVNAPQDERDVWAALDGKLVGIYSLLARAETYLRERLSHLCAASEVKGNSDQVATQALRSLAERADYLVVDTWHAAHQATGAIDSVRPRERQILPKLRGNSGFLRALEDALGG